MTDMTNDYESAWNEGDTAKPAVNALAAAKKVTDAAEKDAYVTAYADVDSGMLVNGEDLKDAKPKDKAQDKSEKSK